MYIGNGDVQTKRSKEPYLFAYLFVSKVTESYDYFITNKKFRFHYNKRKVNVRYCTQNIYSYLV